MQMMQQASMLGGFGAPGIDPAAMPFAGAPAAPDGDPGLEASIIRPALLENRVKAQRALKLGNVLDLMCLTEDGKHALGGVPEGCTMVFVGPPGRGKTRTALASLARVALSGKKCAFVVAEEGFHDSEGRGRDDLCSRLVKVGMAATGLDEANFEKKVLANLFVLEAQYHKSVTWDDFIKKYRYLVEKEGISFVVIDSLNMIDPTKKGTADNLSALKTYNHEQGVTCICIGQIKDTGEPVGGQALQHTADVVFLLEEMSLASKEIAEFWGGKYRDKIGVLHVIKSVTTPTLQVPVRVDRKEGTGELAVHDMHPKDYPIPTTVG
jgi:KaiC/GvpD/RAD55 family RecA-like ATPase